MRQELGGRLVDENEMFTAIAPNITPGARVTEWSDAELAKAIREGIRPDGSLIGPPMPFAMYAVSATRTWRRSSPSCGRCRRSRTTPASRRTERRCRRPGARRSKA